MVRGMTILLVLTLARIVLAEQPVAVETESPYLRAVQTFADNVLDQGRDKYSGKKTPLFVDGINVDTYKPVEWVHDGNRYIISNLASQQNLFRTFVGLSNLTGQKKYRQSAMDAIDWHFKHLRSECGLLRWGGHQFIDLKTLESVGRFDSDCHEFKNNFPFYELMWKVDSEATTQFIRAFWNAHILDWAKLDMNRHGRYGLPMGELWESEFDQPEPFFYARGLTFLNCGTDLIYAAALLYDYNQEEGALVWSQRLAEQYVRARHPETGLGAYQYSKPRRVREVPETGDLPTSSNYGDRCENQFGPIFGDVAREAWILLNYRSVYVANPLIQLELAERLGPKDKGKDFLKWTSDSLTAMAKHAYNPETNELPPMFADGTDLTGFKLPRTGYYGREGLVLKPRKADMGFALTYLRAYRLDPKPLFWQTARAMLQGNGLGDIGEKPGGETKLNLQAATSEPTALYSMLELYRITNNDAYLQAARVIGDNIVQRRFFEDKGFFLPDAHHVNAKFDTVEPLALLALEAAIRGKPELVPVYNGGRGYIHGRFDGKGRTYDSNVIWAKKRPAPVKETPSND